MADSASDVPSKYDLVISDGTTTQGFVLFDPFRSDANIPQKAIHSFSPAFIPRTNIEGAYGDDAQDFFMTYSQNDWSLGEQRRSQDNERRRYWTGSNVDVLSNAGRVVLTQAATSSSAIGSAVITAIHGPVKGNTFEVFAFTSTNLWKLTNRLVDTDLGAHGLAGSPKPFAVAVDSDDIYFSDATTVRRHNVAAGTFSAFSASGATSLSFLNNTLYGVREATADLVKWDTTGAISSIFPWKQADGGVANMSVRRMAAFGGKLLILFRYLYEGSELWLFDGIAPSRIATFPIHFDALDMVVQSGIVYISGNLITKELSSTDRRAAVYYYANGNLGLLWKSPNVNLQGIKQDVGIAALGEDVVFHANDAATPEKFLRYSLSQGGVSSIGEGTFSGGGSTDVVAAGSGSWAFFCDGTTTYWAVPGNSKATTGSITSFLIDFDSSLTKLFRGIKIDYDEDGDGDGGSVDIAYRVGDVDGSYTTLQTGAVSGTEYMLGSVGSEITGRSISVKITLNKGTSSDGPVFKRLYVRAVPVVNTFHRSRAVLYLGGRDGKSPVVLRDQTPSPKDGQELAELLEDFAMNDGLLTVTDKFGSRVSTIETMELSEIKPQEYVAELTFRQV